MESKPDSASKRFNPFRFLDKPKTEPVIHENELSASTKPQFSGGSDELSNSHQLKSESFKIEPAPEKVVRAQFTKKNEEAAGPLLFPTKKKESNRKKLFEKKTEIPAEYAQTRISDFFNQGKKIQTPQSKPYLKPSELGENSELRKYKSFFNTPAVQDFSPALPKIKRKQRKPFAFAHELKVKKEMQPEAKKAKRVNKMVQKGCIQKISNNEIQRLAHRGGVKRVAAKIYDEIRDKLRSFLERLVTGAMDMTEQRGRKTVTVVDVVQTLKVQGAINMKE